MIIKSFLILTACALFFTQCRNRAEDQAIPATGESGKELLDTNNPSDQPADISLTSEITCPRCGYQKTEIMPTDICLIRYNCKKCGAELTPKEGDCCVFCTHGSCECPSVQ